MKELRMEKTELLGATVLLLAAAAAACAVAAEFKKVKAEEMKIDGSLCSLPRSPAFGLGIAAIACLSVAQLVGTSVAAPGLCSKRRQNILLSVTLLLGSWVSFGFAVIILAAASSMNGGQAYGSGWLDGECYVARKGAYAGAAALAVLTAVLILSFAFTAMHPSSDDASAASAGSRHSSRRDEEHK